VEKFYIHTFGCKVNQYESEKIRRQLFSSGIQEASDLKDATFIILNTCAVTSKADSKARRFIRICSSCNSRIIVTGCLAQISKDEISQMKGVCCVVPQQKKENLLQELSTRGIISTSSVTKPHPLNGIKNRTRAFLKIQDGCDRFCAYCIVPYIRGSPVFEDRKLILEETRAMIKNNVKEIVLSGINVGLYPDLSGLIQEIADLEGNFRIRLSSIEINEIDEGIINLVVGNKKICKHLHIPLQSGSDQILRKMERRYTRDFYIKKIESIRNAYSQVSFTTDIIVGFPSETEENFQDTASIIKQIGFLKVHIFPFSVRNGTAAEKLDGRIPPDTVKKRFKYLLEISKKVADEYKSSLLGSKLEVLVEKNNKGFSSNYIPVYIEDRGYVNQIVKVKIRNRFKDGLLGIVI
jgi:threonylcarbamoyladenosine tRNA methylthiotransferase MtaB